MRCGLAELTAYGHLVIVGVGITLLVQRSALLGERGFEGHHGGSVFGRSGAVLPEEAQHTGDVARIGGAVLGHARLVVEVVVAVR